MLFQLGLPSINCCFCHLLDVYIIHNALVHMILYGVSIGAAIYELLLPSTCNVYIIHNALIARLSGMGAKELLV